MRSGGHDALKVFGILEEVWESEDVALGHQGTSGVPWDVVWGRGNLGVRGCQRYYEVLGASGDASGSPGC